MKTCHLQFCTDMLQHLEKYGFSEKLIFSDEATFHLHGKVNRHNVRIWGTENPHSTIGHIRNSPKLNVFCAMSKEKVYGPYSFAEPTVTGTSYLDMMQEWLMPQLDDSDDFIYQQDGGSTTLPPPRPQSAFASTLDRTHGCQRPGATSLATPII
jgi:hypothetical protein